MQVEDLVPSHEQAPGIAARRAEAVSGERSSALTIRARVLLLLAGRARVPGSRPRGLYPLLWTFGLALGSLLSISLALWTVYPRMSATELPAKGHPEPVDLPWAFGDPGAHRLELTMDVTRFTPRRWSVIADDCLTALRVNNRSIALEGAGPSGLCDWQRSFELDLSPALRSGKNQLEFTVTNRGGPGGLALRPLPGWRNLLLAIGVLPWLLALARIFRLRRPQLAILCGALLLLCVYWAVTPANLRSYDVKGPIDTGHLGYIVYIAQHAALPPANAGWEYYQPPLYYVGGALAWRWAAWLGLSGLDTLQAYSLMLWLVFLVSSVATLERALGRSTWRTAVAALGLALWPSGIIDAVRVSNDLALYAAAGVATWFMFRWWRSGRRRHLAGMAVSIAAALLSKSSGSALLAAALALIALRMARKARWRRPRAWADASVAAAIMASGALLSVGRNIWYWWHGKLASWLVGSIAGLDANLRVPNDLRAYVPLDVPVFVTTPWISTRDDASGRTNFWNFLLRSSLSGEFRFEGTLQRVIAIVWGVALLWLLLLLALRLARRPSAAVMWRETPWIVLGVLWLASVLCSRIAYPYSCQGDFRFIVPVLIPFILAWARGRRVAPILLSLVAVSSALFFVSL